MALSFVTPSLVNADSSVVVLGVRSLDGDDELAHDVSLALRAGAQKMPGWNVSLRDVSLAQMSLAHGCDEPDARCMADIATTLAVDRLIYGTALKVGDEVQLALFNFDAITGQVESSLEQKVQSAELAEPAVSATMSSLLRRLAGEKVAGMLRINSDSPGATVWLDGRTAGTLDVRGELLLTEVPAGSHALVVEAPSGRKELSVEVAEGTTASVRVALKSAAPARAPAQTRAAPQQAPVMPDEPGDSRSWRRILGWTAVGLAGGFAAATVVSWVRIDGINKEPNLTLYRDQFAEPGKPGGTSDVCREAEQGTLVKRDGGSKAVADLESSAHDLCQRADRLEVLQYVFLGGAIVMGGVGAYLLLSTPKHKKAGDVSFRPSLSPGRGSLSASLSASVRF